MKKEEGESLHYLDNAATTPVLPEVADVADETLRVCWANPSSLYEPGFVAEQAIMAARKTLAGALGCAEGEVVFTAGGTEANNIGITGAALARRAWGDHIVATGYEHPSAHNTLRLLERELGFRLTLVNPDEGGVVDADALVQAVTPKTVLLCAMHVNNEVGSVLDVVDIAARAKQKNPRLAVHVDGVQAFIKQPLRLAGTAIDTYAVSGHKLHAPKGVGALYLRRGHNIVSPLAGGLQEGGVRPGTENTAYIAAFGRAVEIARAAAAENTERVAALQARLEDGLWGMEGIERNSPKEAQPGFVNFSLPGVRSETMLHFLERREVYISAGSACSRNAPSHTLTAMGKKRERITSALRVSIGPCNTEEDIDALLEGLAAGLATLARGRVGGRGRQ